MNHKYYILAILIVLCFSYQSQTYADFDTSTITIILWIPILSLFWMLFELVYLTFLWKTWDNKLQTNDYIIAIVSPIICSYLLWGSYFNGIDYFKRWRRDFDRTIRIHWLLFILYSFIIRNILDYIFYRKLKKEINMKAMIISIIPLLIVQILAFISTK